MVKMIEKIKHKIIDLFRQAILRQHKVTNYVVEINMDSELFDSLDKDEKLSLYFSNSMDELTDLRKVSVTYINNKQFKKRNRT